MNQLDEIIVFRQLTKTEVKDITDIMLTEVLDRVEKKLIDLKVTERFRDRVVEEGYNPSYGARSLRRSIVRLLEDRVTKSILFGEIEERNSATLDVDFEGNIIVLNGSSGTASSLAIKCSAEVA